MNYEFAEIAYLVNLMVTVGYAIAMFVYLGRHDTRTAPTRAFQQLLAGIVAWAFYDLIMIKIGRTASPETAFLLFRLLSFMWLTALAFSAEQIVCLIRTVTMRVRLMLYAPFALLYLFHVFFPGFTSGRTYGIVGGYGSFPAPFQTTLNVLWMVMFTCLSCWLGIAAFKEIDLKAQKEKTLLLLGILLNMVVMAATRMLLQKMAPGFPALGNTSMAVFVITAFFCISRYGRVLSSRTLYQVTVDSIPSGLVHTVNGRISWTNGALARMLDAPEQTLLGKPIKGLVDFRDDLANGKIGMKPSASAGTDLAEFNGRYFLHTSTPIDMRNPDQGVLHIFTDITEREKIIKELRDALAEIKTLQGFLPICVVCKKIRDDKGYWNQLESYIETHSDAAFSHGMCPDCSDQLYGDDEWYIRMKAKKKP